MFIDFEKRFKVLLIVFIFFVFLFSSVFSIEIRDLENKSEDELYNMAVDFYKKRDDRSAAIVCSHIIKNFNTRNRYVFYIFVDVLIRNIDASSDKQKVYNQINTISDYIINNIDYYDYRAYYYKGWVSYRQGDLTTAETNLKKSVSYFPDFVPSLLLLLNVYIDKKDYDNALKIAEKIISKGNINKNFAYLILRLYVESDRLDKASEFFSKYQSLFDDHKSFYIISLMFFKLGNYNSALDYIEKALLNSPYDEKYLALKIKILYFLRKYDQAYELINKHFKNTTNDEILAIKREIEYNRARKLIFGLIIAALFIIIIILAFVLYREKKIKSQKIALVNLKKTYQERVSTKAENLDILINLIYDFLNDFLTDVLSLNYNLKAAIYVTDPRKDNILYCYFSNLLDLPDVLYVFSKYSGWLNNYSNVPAHLLDIQSDNLFYEWFGAKNLGIFKKNKMNIVMPCLNRNILQCIIFIHVLDESYEQKIINFLRANKELISEILEEIANDVISIRFREAAFIDELTRLYNRRFMFQKLEEEIDKASKNNKKVSFVLCDIDNFKKFNDTYGHKVGDEVLRVVARVFKSAAREFFDWPFRYGGEEIGIILPDTTKEKAFEIAERIRNEVSSKRYENVPTTITISLGVATYPDDAKNIEELIREADEALYYSKKNGKNRTTLAGVKVLNEKGVFTSNDSEIIVDKSSETLANFKIPTFVYNGEQFEEYYNSIRYTYKHKLVSIEASLSPEILNKLIMDIYQSLILIEAIGVEIKDNTAIIKVLFIEREDNDIKKMLSDWQSKYNIKINVNI